MSRMFEEGGWTMWVVLLGAVIATILVILAVGAALMASRDSAIRSSAVALLASLGPPTLGVLAYVFLMWGAETRIAMANPDPETRALFFAIGSREAMNNIVLGGISGAALFSISTALLVRALSLPHRAAIGARG